MRSALDNLMQNRTTIIIARRKVTLEKVDRIIVIDQNCIKEIGSHKELLSAGETLYEALLTLPLNFKYNSFR